LVKAGFSPRFGKGGKKLARRKVGRKRDKAGLGGPAGRILGGKSGADLEPSPILRAWEMGGFIIAWLFLDSC